LRAGVDIFFTQLFTPACMFSFWGITEQPDSVEGAG